jgi:hypothetical protein
MTTSLYDLTVGSYLQTLNALGSVLEKGSTHFAENNRDENDILSERPAADMLPLTFQLHMVNTHSLGCIDGLREGVFQPPRGTPDLDYAGFKAHIATSREKLGQLDPAEVNGFAGKAIVFKLGDMEMPFSAENFVMSFSLPNLYFHSTAAYLILRDAGVPIGKRDFLGQLRMGN